jgi:Domain of unknown function (DUF4124)
VATSCLLAIVALAGAFAPSPATARSIYKCTLEDGKTTFSDTPCKDTSSQQQLQMRGGAPQTVGPSPEAAAAAAAAARRAESGACYSWTPPAGDVVVDPPRRIRSEQLPHDASGNPVEIFVSKRTPMTVAAACSAMVSGCSQHSDDPGKAMDACFKSAPRCASARPWEEPQACCPQACWEKYTDLRRHCVDPSTASYKALFEEHCVPGSAQAQQPAP